MNNKIKMTKKEKVTIDIVLQNCDMTKLNKEGLKLWKNLIKYRFRNHQGVAESFIADQLSFRDRIRLFPF